MRRSAAPSVIAKKRQGKENVVETNSNVLESKSNVNVKVSIGRKKFKSPVAKPTGLVIDPSAVKHCSEGELGSCRAEGILVSSAPLVGRNSSQVLELINSGRVEVEGIAATTASVNLVEHFANSLSPSSLDSIPDWVENLESPSVTNVECHSSLSESSCSVGVKRSFPESSGLENENLDISRKKHHFEGGSGKSECIEEVPASSKDAIVTGRPASVHLNESSTDRSDLNGKVSENSSSVVVKPDCPDDGRLETRTEDIMGMKHVIAMKQGEPSLQRKIECVEEGPALLKETIVTGVPGIESLNVDNRLGTDDLNGRLESTSSEVNGFQNTHGKEEHDNGVFAKLTKLGTVLHGPQRQRASLHEINVKVASKPCTEVVSAEYYSVMYCPRKPNTKRKGPWSDGTIICLGRSCTLQDVDGKAVTKSIVQGLKGMPEGATLEVGKFEVEVLRKVSCEEVLSGSLYLVDKAPLSVPKEVPTLTTKKQTNKQTKKQSFKSFKLQQSRTL